MQAMGCAESAVAIRQPVHEYVSSWRGADLACVGPILRIRVRNMNRFMESAMGSARVEHVDSLGSFVVSLPGFRTDWVGAESNLVGLDDLSLIEQFQRVLLFQH